MTKLRINLCSPQWLLLLAITSFLALAAKAQTLSPSTLPFGNWVVQTTSPAEIVVLSNNTDRPADDQQHFGLGELRTNFGLSDRSQDAAGGGQL